MLPKGAQIREDISLCCITAGERGSERTLPSFPSYNGEWRWENYSFRLARLMSDFTGR